MCDVPADMVRPMSEWTEPMTDADRQQAMIDLLAVLAYGELIAFERLAEDAGLAPSVADKAASPLGCTNSQSIWNRSQNIRPIQAAGTA